MALKTTVLGISVAWVALISSAHWFTNMHVDTSRPMSGTAARPPFRVGFLPVTCHLTCPVTDFINRQLSGNGFFQPLRFSGFPELKEAFLSGHTSATFILAPMAMALREQGVGL